MLSSIPDEAFESLIGCYNSPVSEEETQALEKVLGLVATSADKASQQQQHHHQHHHEAEDSLENLFGGHSNMIDMLMECASSECGSLEELATTTTEPTSEIDGPLQRRQLSSPPPSPQTPSQLHLPPMQEARKRCRREEASKSQVAASGRDDLSDGIAELLSSSSSSSRGYGSFSSSSSSSAASASPSASSGIASPPTFNASNVDIMALLGLPADVPSTAEGTHSSLDPRCLRSPQVSIS